MVLLTSEAGIVTRVKRDGGGTPSRMQDGSPVRLRTQEEQYSVTWSSTRWRAASVCSSSR